MMLEEPALGRARCPQRAATAGSGQLTVELVCGKSAATTVQAHSPLKILVPRPRGESVWAYQSNFGGGLLPGDKIDLQVTVAEGAKCFLGAQSSTKIFRAGPAGPVRSNLRAEVGANALLVYAPEVSQCFANARYIQRQQIHLTDESSWLVFLDWYSAGRSARGERWQFSEYASRTEIFLNARPIFLDSICLEATDRLKPGLLTQEPYGVPPSGGIPLPDRMGRANCLATLVIIGDALDILSEIAANPITKRPEALEVASAIPNGAVLRYAGNSVEHVAHKVFSRLNFISSLLGDNPFNRKW